MVEPPRHLMVFCYIPAIKQFWGTFQVRRTCMAAANQLQNDQGRWTLHY